MFLVKMLLSAAALCALVAATPALAKEDRGSSAYQVQKNGELNIPVCRHRIGTIAIVEPDNQWWREYNLGSPEAIIKIFVQKSGCFGLVNRGRSMASRNMERAMADSGELQDGSNLGKGQVRPPITSCSPISSPRTKWGAACRSCSVNARSST